MEEFLQYVNRYFELPSDLSGFSDINALANSLKETGYCCATEIDGLCDYLENSGNLADNWSDIYVHRSTSALEEFKHIRGNVFHGIVILFTPTAQGEPCKRSPTIINNYFEGTCVISKDCHIHQSSFSNSIVMRGACIINCSDINLNSSSPVKSVLKVRLGAENGGRDILVRFGDSYESICTAALSKSYRHTENGNKASALLSLSCSIFGNHCEINNCKAIRNSIFDNGVRVSHSSIEQSILIGESINITNDVSLRSCFVHNHCHLERFVNADSTIFMSNSSASDNCRIASSVIAHDASISGLECHHSLFGPILGGHHHGLLIATLWPNGRGNLGYGSKVGSNHTSRVNDQECLMGEGVFVGLNVDIKLPFQSLESPYSIVASAVVLMPQKVSFPFSLFTMADESSTRTRISPAWVLHSNAYFVERGNIKFASRSKSQVFRTGCSIFRPVIMDCCLDAYRRIQQFLMSDRRTVCEERGVVLENDINGFGKCEATFHDIVKSEKSYENALLRYCLHGFLHIAIVHLKSTNEREISIEVKKHRSHNVCPDHIEGDNKFLPAICDLQSLNIASQTHRKVQSLRIESDEKSYLLTDSDDIDVFGHQMTIFSDVFHTMCQDHSINISIEKKRGNVEIISVKLSVNSMAYLLQLLQLREDEIAQRLYNERTRDLDRGSLIIDDYCDVNDFANANKSDATIEFARARAKHIQEIVDKIR